MRAGGIAIAVALAFAAGGIKARSVKAATGGYPWPNAPCQWGGTGACTRYDWYVDKNGNGHLDGTCDELDTRLDSPECFDQWGYEYRNCTSWVAYRLSLFGYSMPAAGNANQWDDYFRAHGVTVNTTPAAGSIAQSDLIAPGFGHVAFVEQVNRSNGQIYITEYNRLGGPGAFYQGWVNATDFQNFIHVNDFPTVTYNADINRDGYVDISDLAIIIIHFGERPVVPDAPVVFNADINQDGIINGGDLSVMAARWHTSG